jgi:hypothetical protein
MHRVQERLSRAREKANRPGPEKAARRQELNKKLRVREMTGPLVPVLWH